MPADAAIAHLSPATRTKLRSTQILTTLTQIVSELLQNSLDANASHVEIGVDCEEWSCWVRDNGVGMSKQDMALLAQGTESGRYGTSKDHALNSLNSVSTFGFRGEALASAADLSCIEISSRTTKSRESWSIILKGGKSLYNGSSIRWRRESPGTVVCIRDVFYNLPVRRLSHASPSRTLDLIRQEVETYSLAFPHVSFSLENAHNSREGSSQRKFILRLPKTSSILSTFRHIYGRALAEHTDEIDATSGGMKLQGFISLDGAHSKAYQFLYINRHAMASGDLQRMIDGLFGASSFAKHALDENGDTDLPRSSMRRSPRKSERRPIYVLNLILPTGRVDNALEPSKSAVQLQDKTAVMAFLSSVIESFLQRHGFTCRPLLARNKTRNDESPSPRKRRKLGPEVRRGEDDTTSTLVSRPPNILNDPYITLDAEADDEGNLVWKDEKTGEAFVIDSRTGNSYPQGKRLFDQDQTQQDRILPAPTLRRTLSQRHGLDSSTASLADGTMPIWIDRALNANQAYSVTEAKIPSFQSTSAFVPENRDADRLTSDQHTCGEYRRQKQSISQYLTRNSASLSHRFRKADLLGAEVISQVDRKFIACLMNSDCKDDDDEHAHGGSALVLIDQHAADERIRVERFLKALCLGYLDNTLKAVVTRELSPPVPVLLTKREAWRLQSSDDIQLAFRRWGFYFADMPKVPNRDRESGIDDKSNGFVQVSVRSIPEVVSDKLLLGDELRELVKGFIAKLETDPSSALSQPPTIQGGAPDASGEDSLWLKALRWCPRELLDLVNSKACRGAIMFNDSLTLSQCEKLVRELAGTAFPFQCAHGRPSLVPLADVGLGRGDATRKQRSGLEWGRLERSSPERI